MRVQQGQCAEARAEPGTTDAAADELVERGDELAGERRGCGVRLGPVIRRHEGDAMRRRLAHLDEPPQDRQKPRTPHVLRAVEHHEHGRARSGRNRSRAAES